MSTIKGYLPVRVKLQSFINEKDKDETFFYVKEHQQKDSATAGKQSDTLFVTNAPVISQIRTRVLLKAVLGRFGDVKRVVVVEDPQKSSVGRVDEAAALQLHSWTSRFAAPSFLAPSLIEGSFAHVVFTSNKEMKRAMKALQRLMSDDNGVGSLPGIELETIELQTLRDTSDRHWDDDDADFDDYNGMSNNGKKSGFAAVVERYQSQCRQLSRADLLDECNNVMESFEDAEDLARKARAEATSTVDEDGFVTVSYSSQAASKQELEQDASQGDSDRRRKGQKRNRKRKQGVGATELPDFYRFQTKVNRKRTVQELRERFEEDLVKLKKMKDEKQFRPF